MKFFKIIVAGILLPLSLSLPASAQQQYRREESEAAVDKGDHDIFGTADHHYIVITTQHDEDKETPQVAGYDAGLKRLYASAIPELGGKHYEGGTYTANGLIVYYSDKDHNLQQAVINPATGHLSGSPSALFSCEEVKGVPEFFFGSSADHKYQYVFGKFEKKKQDGTSFVGVITDQQMKVITKFSFEAPQEKYKISDIVGLPEKDGSMDIVFGASEKTSKENYSPYRFTVVQVNQQGKTKLTEISDLPEGDMRGLYWTHADKKLRFAGLQAPKKKGGFSAFVTGIFDPEQKKTTDIRITELNKLPDVANSSFYYMKQVVEKGIPIEASPEIPFECSDGSRVLVYHVTSSYRHQSYFAGVANPGLPANGTPSFSVPHITSGNVYLVKVNANNEPQWLRIVPKDQDEPDMNLHIGFTSFIDKSDGLHLFFYDRTKNSSAEPVKSVGIVGVAASGSTALACVYVSADGKMSKTFLYDTKEYEFKLSPERSFSFYPGELLFVSFKTKGMSFTTKRLVNSAEYKLGIITVK